MPDQTFSFISYTMHWYSMLNWAIHATLNISTFMQPGAISNWNMSFCFFKEQFLLVARASEIFRRSNKSKLRDKKTNRPEDNLLNLLCSPDAKFVPELSLFKSLHNRNLDCLKE